MGGLSRVEVVGSRGCSKIIVDLSSSFRGLQVQSFEPMSPALSSVWTEPAARPFAGLVICVTGLSKEARKQVKEATERLGGQYSANLSPQCTHLVVQNSAGRKLDNAFKHGSKVDFFIVTLGWFVDSVTRNARLKESLYTVKGGAGGDRSMRTEQFDRISGLSGAENSISSAGFNLREEPLPPRSHANDSRKHMGLSLTLSSHVMYIDSRISDELRSKVYDEATKEGGQITDQWFEGCNASLVVCEQTSAHRYIGHSNNLVTPLWVLRTSSEKCLQRLVHLSADLAWQVGLMLEKSHKTCSAISEVTSEGSVVKGGQSNKSIAIHEERKQIVSSAKVGVRNRRVHRMEVYQSPIRPLNPSFLLDSIRWLISEPTSAASIYTGSSRAVNGNEHQSMFFYATSGSKEESEDSISKLTRLLNESEKTELIIKNHFLTILFPVDRFSEMGPSARTYFSDNGFTCLQVLDHVFTFYQENMSLQEIEVAIHTDSRHADRLRAVYSSKEAAELGYVAFKRIEFLGSRKSFEMLKRVTGDNSAVYELILRA